MLISGTHSSKSEQPEAQVLHLLNFFFTFCSGCFFQQLVANKDSLEAQISVSNVTDSQVCPPLASCSHSASSFEVPSTMESEVHRIPAKRGRPVGSVSKVRTNAYLSNCLFINHEVDLYLFFLFFMIAN